MNQSFSYNNKCIIFLQRYLHSTHYIRRTPPGSTWTRWLFTKFLPAGWVVCQLLCRTVPSATEANLELFTGASNGKQPVQTHDRKSGILGKNTEDTIARQDWKQAVQRKHGTECVHYTIRKYAIERVHSKDSIETIAGLVVVPTPPRVFVGSRPPVGAELIRFGAGSCIGNCIVFFDIDRHGVRYDWILMVGES